MDPARITRHAVDLSNVRVARNTPAANDAPARPAIQLPAELTQGFEREARLSMRLMKGPNEQAAAVTRSVAERFGELATDKRAFHDLLKQVFGDGYDAAKAEQYRQLALKGDFTWLPPVRFVSDATLGGANGAYDSAQNVVFINSKLLADPRAAADVYAHELGHFFDARLNRKDSPGDEGELFRLLLSGQHVTAAQVAAIRADNATGTIVVDGKTVEVEFWNPFKAVAKAIGGAVSAVGRAISGAAHAVGKAASGIWNGLKSAGEGIFGGVKTFLSGLWEGTSGFVGNLFKGRFVEAFKSLGDGAAKAFIDAPHKVIRGAIDGLDQATTGLTYLLGPLGKPLRAITTRVFDAARVGTMAVMDSASAFVRTIGEGTGCFVGALGALARGDFSDALELAKRGALKTFVQSWVDSAALAGVYTLTALQTLIGVQSPSRGLTPREIEMLRQVYGDSIDYDQVRVFEGPHGLMEPFEKKAAAFNNGNCLFMKQSLREGSQAQRDAILVHEMAHTWQFQNGSADYFTDDFFHVTGPSPESGREYEWTDHVPGVPWELLPLENQTEFIEQAFRYGAFDPSSPNYGRFEYDYDHDGDLDDLTDYFQDVRQHILNGEGAP